MINQQPINQYSPQYQSKDFLYDQNDQQKQKKIKKERKKKVRMHPIQQNLALNQIQHKIKKIGNDMTYKTRTEILEFYKNKILSRVHLNTIFGPDDVAFTKNRFRASDAQLTKYFNLIRQNSGKKVSRMRLRFANLRDKRYRNKNQEFQLNMNLIFQNTKHTPSCHLLTSNQMTILKQRYDEMRMIDKKIQQISLASNLHKPKVSQLSMQLLVLTKINASEENDIINMIAESSKRLSKYESQPMNQSDLKNEYISMLIRKNLNKSFNQDPKDMLNYFKTIDHLEKNIDFDCQFDPISNFNELKQYLDSKRIRPKKKQNHLKTCCTACFGDFVQLSNPIQSCPQCHCRIHKYCQKIENRCHRCRYGRLSNKQKCQTYYCYICHRNNQKNLLILTVNNSSPHQFAHVFCLLVHKRWSIQYEQLRGHYAVTNDEKKECKFCSEKSSDVFYCFICNESMHAMCAYLSGCSMKMHNYEFKQYQVKINCCVDEKVRNRLSLQRKFRVNYQKLAFRIDQQLFNQLIIQ